MTDRMERQTIKKLFQISLIQRFFQSVVVRAIFISAVFHSTSLMMISFRSKLDW
jgi:hypothetical protein